MNKTIAVFDFFGMRVQVHRSTVPASLVLWVILAAVVYLAFDASLLVAIIGGVVAVALHWLANLIHHYGHYTAARWVERPHRLVTMWNLLGTDRYPQNEAPLSAQGHIRRALGGPIASLLASVVFGLIALVGWFIGGIVLWPLYFAFLGNLFIFTLGSFVPLHFVGIETDGSTLLHYWKQAA